MKMQNKKSQIHQTHYLYIEIKLQLFLFYRLRKSTQPEPQPELLNLIAETECALQQWQ